jgi:DNA-binding NarL/FixJ family response regulator
MKTTIAIADDHRLFSESLANILNQNPHFEVIKIVENGAQLIEYLNFNQPQLVLLDYNMPEMNGYETAQVILKKYPEIKVLIVTMNDSENFMQPLMKLGIHGAVIKNVGSAELTLAIEKIMMGNTYFSQEIISNIAKALKQKETVLVQFTPREKDILKLLKQGLNTKDMAEKLFISPHTVESHRKNLLAKTDSKNTLQLLNYATENGLI